MTVDVETDLIGALVDDNVLDGNISSRLPSDFDSHLPYVTLRRAPGSRYVDTNTRRLEAVRLEVQAHDDDDVGAFNAAKTVLEAISTFEGVALPTLYITAVDIPQTPQWSPDPESARPRYIAYVLVYAHAALVGS